MYVKKFEDLSKDDLGIAGGKGANLGELTQAGIPVPPGFVVTSKTYDKFMRDTGIFNSVMDILDQVDINNTKELQEAAEKIKAIIIYNDKVYKSNILTFTNESSVDLSTADTLTALTIVGSINLSYVVCANGIFTEKAKIHTATKPTTSITTLTKPRFAEMRTHIAIIAIIIRSIT